MAFGAVSLARAARLRGAMEQREKELRESLRCASEIVLAAATGSLSMDKFLEAYDAFYYFEALDGHEADSAEKELLAKYATVIAIHCSIQQEIVDLTFPDDEVQKELYLGAGRITNEMAKERLRTLVETRDLQSLVGQLNE